MDLKRRGVFPKYLSRDPDLAKKGFDGSWAE
jgi:hypothetical protein